MATISGTTQVKFVKVLELADFNDITPVDGTIYFIEDAKKIYLDGKMYGFNDSDVDGKFLPITGGDMKGSINTTPHTLYVAYMENVERITGTSRGNEERDFIAINDFGVTMKLTGEEGDLLSYIDFHPDGIKLKGEDSNMSIRGLDVYDQYDSDFKDIYSDAALAVGTMQNFKGANGGFAELNEHGVVPTHQLPSYVDDIIEFTNKASFPATGEAAKLYVDISNSFMYRWGGTAYYNVSDGNAPLKLGTSSSTAYRGDHGLAAYNHSKVTGNPHGVTKYDVKLGSVENYEIASVIEAKQGSAKDKYMTPETTKEAIVTLAPKLTWTVVS